MPVRRLRALLPAVLALALAGPRRRRRGPRRTSPTSRRSPPGTSATRPAGPPSRGPRRCPRRVTHAAVPAGQPVFPCEFPDPTIFRDPATHAWYAYATAVGWNHERHLFPILKSTDLKGWRAVGDGLRAWPRWAYTELWAPTVVRARRHLLPLLHGQAPPRRVHCIGVATAPAARAVPRPRAGGLPRRPDEGLHRPRGAPDAAAHATCTSRSTTPTTRLAVQPLREDLLRPAGPRRTLLRFGDPWQRGLAFGTVEAPSSIRRGGRVLLFYSGGCWCFDYRMGLRHGGRAHRAVHRDPAATRSSSARAG